MTTLIAGLWEKTTVRRGAIPSVHPWEVYCHCGLLFGMVAWSVDWQTAQNWAAEHAAKHEATRCKTCGKLA